MFNTHRLVYSINFEVAAEQVSIDRVPILTILSTGSSKSSGIMLNGVLFSKRSGKIQK